MENQPNIDILARINPAGFAIGDTIIFCPECWWQSESAGMANQCPSCSEKGGLMLAKVDRELIELSQEVSNAN